MTLIKADSVNEKLWGSVLDKVAEGKQVGYASYMWLHQYSFVIYLKFFYAEDIRQNQKITFLIVPLAAYENEDILNHEDKLSQISHLYSMFLFFTSITT